MAAIHTTQGSAEHAFAAVLEYERDEQVAWWDRVAAAFAVFPSQLQTAPAVTVTQSHYRRASDSFAADANGIAYIFNGIDQPQVFDPSYGSVERAGVLAPTSATTVSGSGNGNIVGQFYCYTRFVDRNGNLSSLSPISAMYEAQTQFGTISGATYTSPIVVTCTNAGVLGAGQVVKISGVIGNTAANGIYAVQPLTSSTFALYTDQSLTVPVNGNGTYVSGGKAYTGVSRIVYSNVPISTETKVVRRQILRNQDGDTNTFYIDIDTEDLTSTLFTSQTDSDSLLDFVALEDTDGNSLVDKSLPPDFKKVCAFHLGRMFATANESYSEGAVSVTNGSKIVTGIGTEWGVITFVGRYFEVVGGTQRYKIARMISTTSLELEDAYAGTTEPYAYYSIHVPDGERRSIYWSEPGESEAWPLRNTLNMAEDPNAGEITGLMVQNSWIYILAEARMYRFSFVNDPLLDGFIVKSAQRGCVNNRCWVMVENIAYMLDTLGIHAFAGNDDQDIGTPAVQDLFRTAPTGPYKINWTARRNFHAIYSPGEGTIKWFVSLGTCYTPSHAICYHVRLKRWWIEEYPFPVGASCLGRLQSKPQIYLGTNGKRVMASAYGTLDGPDPTTGDTRFSVTSSGVNWVAGSSATFPTSGLVGNPIVIVRGKGKGQRRTIHSVSGTTIYVTDPWLDLPDTTSVCQVGGIQWLWKSGWASWAETETGSTRAISIQYKPTTEDAEMYLRLYRDLSGSAQDWVRDVTLVDQNGIGHLEDDPSTDLSIDTTKTNGYVVLRIDGDSQLFVDGNRRVSLELRGVQNDMQFVVWQVRIEGALGGR